MFNVKVSVIIPTKDRVEYLKRAIDSVLCQSYAVFEIIVVDDASEDVDYKFLSEIPTVKLILNKHALGGAGARNVGIRAARGDIVMFLDDDDAWLPNKVQEQLLAFDNDREVVLVFSGRKIVRSSDLATPIRSIEATSGSINLTNMCLKNCVGTTSSVAILREKLLEVEGFDNNLPCYQDYDLWLRLSMVGKLASDKSSGVLYTIFDEPGHQISRKQDGRHVFAKEYLLKKYKGKLSVNDYKRLESNLNFMTSKAILSYSKFKALRFAAISLIKSPNVRSFKMMLLSLAVVFGLKSEQVI